jgi:cell division protein FtsN
MPRDYKHAGAKKKKATSKESPMPCWICFGGGLFVGLLIAAVIYVKFAPGVSSQQVKEKGSQVEQGQKQKQGKEKPRFDFYSILPKLEIIIPEQELRSGNGSAEKDKGMAEVKQTGTYILQAGSFRKFEEADKLKAELALIGIEAGIERVSINNSDTWHRVRIGPFDDLKQLNKVRLRLMENDIEVLLLKVKS